MADLNWCLAGTAWKVIRSGGEQGSIPNINDNDEGTFHAVGISVPPEAGGGIDFDHGVDFAEAANNINKVEILNEAGVSSGGITSAKVYLYYSGGYHEVLDLGTGSWGKTLFSQTGSWNNVTKIKFTCTGGCYNPYAPSMVSDYTYELRAWGPANYMDIGIRIRKSSQTIKIGVKGLEASHKLRIRKGGTTYGIPLLSTGDGDASPIRIYDGSAIKALPKVD
jgi:hypothetical protein